MKYTITLTLSGQELIKNRSAILYTHEQNYVALHFLLDDFWKSIEAIGCIFKKDGQSITVMLDDNNDAVVPWELLKCPGTLYVSLFGGDRMTTCEVDIAVLESGWDEGSIAPSAPTVDAFNDILSRLSEAEKLLQSTTTSATMANYLANTAITNLSGKVDKVSGKDLSSNDFTDSDKELLDSLRNPNKISLADPYGNSLHIDSTGNTVIDTNLQDLFTAQKMGYKISPCTTTSPAGNTRGATLQMTRRLNGENQSLNTLFLTTGLVEIRVGTTSALDNSAQGVYTAFTSKMSNTPDIVLMQAKSGQTGIAAPKLVNKNANGFYATLGGSTGNGTACEYIAIKFNYVPNMN